MNTGVLATRLTGIHQEFNAYVTNIIPRPSLKSPRCVSYTKMIYCPSCSSARAWTCGTRSLQWVGMGRDSEVDWPSDTTWTLITLISMKIGRLGLGLGLGLWSQSWKRQISRFQVAHRSVQRSGTQKFYKDSYKYLHICHSCVLILKHKQSVHSYYQAWRNVLSHATCISFFSCFFFKSRCFIFFGNAFGQHSREKRKEMHADYTVNNNEFKEKNCLANNRTSKCKRRDAQVATINF